MSVSLSIVIPAYNEESCIAASLEQVLRFAAGRAERSEVIVVDDGSTDGTAAAVEAAIGQRGDVWPRLRLIRQDRNRGKGFCVRTGFEHAAGEIVLFTDADLSAPIEEADKLIEPIAAGRCDIAIGSRAIDPSLVEEHPQFRRQTGRVFNYLVRLMTGLPLRDTQCGFKAFRRSAAARLFALQRLEGFAFDVELLYLARRYGRRVRELPVRWKHVGNSKVSLLGDGARMFADLWRIRLNQLQGRYDPGPDSSPAACTRSECRSSPGTGSNGKEASRG